MSGLLVLYGYYYESSNSNTRLNQILTLAWKDGGSAGRGRGSSGPQPKISLGQATLALGHALILFLGSAVFYRHFWAAEPTHRQTTGSMSMETDGLMD